MMNRPNVLLMYTDQQRWDALQAAGNSEIITPNLDALAESGVRFSHAFANHPVCQPSRMSMLSGQYGESLGIAFNGIEMPQDVPCVHNMLKPYNYHTAQIGKLHFLNHFHRDHRDPHPTYGFDTLIVSDEPGCYDDAFIRWVREHDPAAVDACRCSTHQGFKFGPTHDIHPRKVTTPYVFGGPDHLTHTAFVADETRGYLRRHRHDQFFCFAGFYAPHTPLNPPRRFLDMYDPATLALPPRNEGENGGLTDEEWRNVKAHYYALVTHLDEGVGRIMATLDELGLRENTLVVFTSDHGEKLGHRGQVEKVPPEDCSSRVPLLVSWPARIPAGQSYDSIIEAVDIVPTILDCCGVQIPSYLQGRSFRPLCEGGEYEERDSAYISIKIPTLHAYKAIRTHDFLYVRQAPHSRFGDRACSLMYPEALYDLSRDPHQLTNVVNDPAYSDAVHSMRNRLLERWFDVESQYPRRTGSF